MKISPNKATRKWLWILLAALGLFFYAIGQSSDDTKEAGSTTVLSQAVSSLATDSRQTETSSASESISQTDTVSEQTPPVSKTDPGKASSSLPQTKPPASEIQSEKTIASSRPQTHPPATTPPAGAVNGRLAVHFIDVGQGDAILIQLPNGQNMLIDGGEASKSSVVVDFLKSKNVSHLDYLVATHPHADHIGGLPAVIKEFSIGQVYMLKVEHTTKTYENLLTTIADKGLKIKTARAGVSLLNETGLSVGILGPVSETYKDLNNYSAVVQIAYQNTAFLFLGDAEKESEAELVARYGNALAADVVKAGHHGSKTSSTAALIAATKAKHVIFSLGKDNSYGHPHENVWEAWHKTGAALYRTDASGTVTVISDGKTLTVFTES